MTKTTGSAVILSCLLAAATTAMTAPAASANSQCGKASWYQLRGTTASGAAMNPNAMTAAHRTLPFGTKVQITNRANGRSVTVAINDRGPFIKGRVIDVSRAAAIRLGFKNRGHTRVCLQKLG